MYVYWLCFHFWEILVLPVKYPSFAITFISSGISMGFFYGSAGKESACNVGDLGSIPGLRRSPGEGRGYPLQYSGLENSMACIVHVSQRHNWVTFTHTYTMQFTQIFKDATWELKKLELVSGSPLMLIYFSLPDTGSSSWKGWEWLRPGRHKLGANEAD